MPIRAPGVLKDAGFVVSESVIGRSTDLALVTLRRAIESYCQTAPSMMHQLWMFDPKRKVPDKDIVTNHGLSYVEAAFETIIHFQHFAEIVAKRVLSEAHPLLPVSQTGARHHVLVFDLLKAGKPPEEDVDALPWMEFSDSLERLVALLDKKKLDAATLSFFTEHDAALKVVNGLRNRLLHRGRFILRYDALDELVAGYLLPFALSATQLPPYAVLPYWKPPKLACGLDPLAEMVRPGAYELRRVAFFKALAHASFRNPLAHRGFLDPEQTERIQRHAEESAALDDPEVDDVRVCPVCGVKSLALIKNTDSDEDPNTGNVTKWWWNIFMVKCGCCEFEVHDCLENPSAYGLNVPDFWYGKEY